MMTMMMMMITMMMIPIPIPIDIFLGGWVESTNRKNKQADLIYIYTLKED